MSVIDINRAVSRRSELTSGRVLMVEQTNSWKLLHLRATLMQHRGGKHLHR